MRKPIATLLMSGAVAACLLINCGGAKRDNSVPAGQAVTGVAAAGAPISGVVSLKDASIPAIEIRTRTAADGSYSLNVTGLSAPFLLKVEWSAQGRTQRMYSFAPTAAVANINPFSNAAIAAATGVDDPSLVYEDSEPVELDLLSADLPAVIDMLKAKLAPLFERFDTAQNPVSDAFAADHKGLDLMLDNIRIVMSSGNIVVLNPSGATIFSGPLRNIADGTFTEENMPPDPGPT